MPILYYANQNEDEKEEAAATRTRWKIQISYAYIDYFAEKKSDTRSIEHCTRTHVHTSTSAGSTLAHSDISHTRSCVRTIRIHDKIHRIT